MLWSRIRAQYNVYKPATPPQCSKYHHTCIRVHASYTHALCMHDYSKHVSPGTSWWMDSTYVNDLLTLDFSTVVSVDVCSELAGRWNGRKFRALYTGPLHAAPPISYPPLY